MVRILFFLAGLSIFGVAIALNGKPGAFLDLNSLVVTIGPPLFLTVGFHGGRALLSALGAGIKGTRSSEVVLRHHRLVLQTLRNLFCASGTLGFLIGLMLMLMQLDDPSKIGPGMAVALLCPLYAVSLAELLVAPMIHRLAACQPIALDSPGDSDNPPSGKEPSGARGLLTLLVAVLGGSGTLLVLWAAIA